MFGLLLIGDDSGSGLVVLIVSGVQLAMGIGLLNGQYWALMLFTWLIPISIIYGVIAGTANWGSLIKGIGYLVCMDYLSSPDVKAYFEQFK